MFPLKALVLCSLLFTWAGCLNMRNNAHGVNYEETSDEEAAAAYDDYSTDKEEHTIQERMTNDEISDADIKTISSEIWNSVSDLQVQYDGKPDSKGKRRLFNHEETKDNAIDKCFKDLFPFYEKQTGKQDPCEESKNLESCNAAKNDFLKHIFSGEPISILYDRLKRHGTCNDSYEAFKKRLKTMWFKAYSRTGGALDSSGFEHVFLGEITEKGDVDGLHNWMRMYEEEQSNNFILTSAPFYKNNAVAKISFKWFDRSKTSSFFMKKSPAVEIALYTLCFMARPDKYCSIDLGSFLVRVKTVAVKKNDKSLIWAAYPEIP